MHFKLLFLTFIFPFVSISQINEEYLNTLSNKDNYYYPLISKKNKTLKTPPGTKKLNDSIYIDVSPVNNIMYNEFYSSITHFWSFETHDSIKKLPNFGNTKTFLQSKLENTKIDSTLINDMLPLHNTFVGNLSTQEYFNDYKFSYYPIVNITKYQAEMYCKWRTDLVKILASIIYKTPESRLNFPLHFTYRLPTKLELQSALNLYGYSKIKTKPINDIYLKSFAISNRKKYKKVYFFKDNISEYTIDNSIFGKGTHTGFRCVCEVKK